MSRIGDPIPDVPLHRRFRLWLPLCGTLPWIVAISALRPPLVRGAPSSLAVLGYVLLSKTVTGKLLDVALTALLPESVLPLAEGAVAVTVWYLIGFALDWLRSDKARQSANPGWPWLMAFVSFIELIVTTDDSLVVLQTFVNSLRTFGADPRALVNDWVVGLAVPVVMACAWALVLIEAGMFIGSRRYASSAGPAAGSSGQNASSSTPSGVFGRGRTTALVGAVVVLRMCILFRSTLAYLIVRHTDPMSDVLLELCALAIAAIFLKRVFPDYRLGQALREQIRWGKLRRHLAFGGTALAIFIAGMAVALYLGDHFNSAVLRAAAIITFRSLPLLLLLTFYGFYSRQWRDRRHFIFALIFWAEWTGVQLNDDFHGSFALQKALNNLLPWILFLSFLIYYQKWLFPGFLGRNFVRAVLRWFRERRLLHYLAIAAALCGLIGIFVQSRDAFWKTLVCGFLLFFLRQLVGRNSTYRWMLYGGVPICLILALIGGYNPERDVLLALVGFALAYAYWLLAVKRGWPHSSRSSAVLLFLAVWALCSAGDAISLDHPFGSGSETSSRDYFPERFGSLNERYPGKHVGVALSGGGYRAAVMHAGVLQGLEDLKIPVTNISAVSGGSITGAYYALGGKPSGILDAIVHHQLNTARDFVDIQNAARLISAAPFPSTHVRLVPGYSFGRTDVQASALDRVLLHGRTFADLPSGGPRLMIGVTDLNSGSALGLTRRWRVTRFLLRPPGEELFPNVRSLFVDHPRMGTTSSFAALDSGNSRLSKVVAASGAFPLAFEPVRLVRGQADNFLMVDGGVSDNSGMTLLLEADRRASLNSVSQPNPLGDHDWALDVAIAVDGGAMFQRSFTDPDTTPLDVAGRAVDMIHSRVGPTKPEGAHGPVHPSGPAMVLLSPALYMDNSRNFDYRGISTDFRTQGLGPEQQELLELLVTQIANMDHESFMMLRRLHSSLTLFESNKAFADIYSKIDANWLSEEESRTLQQSHAKAVEVSGINAKRTRRTRALFSLTLELARDFSQCLSAFVTTPTLSDDIPTLDAHRLYRLGQYLAVLNSREIRQRLDGESAYRPAREITPAEKATLACAVRVAGDNGRFENARDRQTSNTALDVCLQQQIQKDPALEPDIANVAFRF